MDKETLFAQLQLVTTTMYSGGQLHRVPMVEDVKINTPGGTRTPRQVAWFLENDAWEYDLVSPCGVENCASHVNLAGQSTTMDEDDKVLELVQRTSVTLADLYRKGRAKGVITAQSTGYN